MLGIPPLGISRSSTKNWPAMQRECLGREERSSNKKWAKEEEEQPVYRKKREEKDRMQLVNRK